MGNVHRRFFGPEQIESVLRACGITSPLTGHVLLTGGTFNSVYRLRFADRPGLVVKLSPDPHGAKMTYEQGLVETEAQFYTLVGAATALPVPDVVAVQDLGPELGGGQMLLVSELPGAPWYGSGLAATDRGGLRSDLGRMVASLHGITGPSFGYPSESTGPLTSSWAEAFEAMIDAVLADAVHFQVDLPVDPRRIRDALATCSKDLATVEVPSLVHFDLWDGNVLLDLAGTPRISGIIDGERAMWGDPVMDFASAALFGEIRDDEDFIRGYESAGLTMPLDESARRRLLLYRAYLGLIMAVEPIPRGYPKEGNRLADIVVSHLQADLAELEQLAVGADLG
jgi:aminoglycoside phosphotransferase (APT) family kinase protein